MKKTIRIFLEKDSQHLNNMLDVLGACRKAKIQEPEEVKAYFGEDINQDIISIKRIYLRRNFMTEPGENDAWIENSLGEAKIRIEHIPMGWKYITIKFNGDK